MKRILGRLFQVLMPSSALARETTWQGYVDSIRNAVTDRRFDEIEGRLDQALNWLRSLPPEEKSRPERLSELADLYQSLAGDNNRAEQLFRESIDLAERVHGADSLEIALPLNNLSLFLIQQRRHSEAEAFLNRLLPIAEKHFGPEHPEVASCLENLSAVYRNTGRSEQAGRVRTRATRIRRDSRQTP